MNLEPEPREEPAADDDDDGAAEPAGKRRGKGALLYVQRLSKLYPVRRGLFGHTELLRAVDGVSFYVRRGETFALVGESGSGKSTLSRCILRLSEPTVGRVVFDGQDVTALSGAELRAMRRRMQIVFQNPYSSLNPSMTVQEIVGEGIDVFGLARGRAEVDERVGELVARVGLGAELLWRYPHELSGGQRQRIAIARALAVRPEFLVLDEPLSALDVSVQAQILNLLDDLQEDLGLTLLFVTHDLRAARYTSHRLGVMYAGRLVEVGPTRLVALRRLHPYTRALFGALPPPPGQSGPESRRLQVVLDGEPPSLLEPPRGCAFFARCPESEPGRCDLEAPELRETHTGDKHRVACWRPHVEGPANEE